MNKKHARHAFLAVIGCIVSPLLHAATVEVAAPLDFRIVEETLAQQVFTGPDRTVEVFADAIACNTLALSKPRVLGDENGQLRLVTDMQARVGTPIGQSCRFSKSWEGVVETEQTAHVQPGTAVVTFQVVGSRLLRANDGKDALPGFMQGWINSYVHPRLGKVTVDLAPALDGIRALMDLAASDHSAAAGAAGSHDAWSVSLSDVSVTSDALVALLLLDVPDAPAGWSPADESPLTDAELAAWDANWQAWDAFATWMIITLAAPAGPELTRTLAETWLEARYELRDALARDDRTRDPVRELFLNTWSRLAPLLHDRDLPIPGGQALGFAGFIGAGNALQALDRLAPHIGLYISRDSLRAMARMLAPEVSDAALGYSTAVNPELRALLGLGPALEVVPLKPRRRSMIFGHVLDWLIPSAHAAQIDPRLVQRLNTWVPRRLEIDNYLQAMARLLDAISLAEHTNAKVPKDFLEVYDPLLRATAWQESCWRQYVERNGVREPIRSSAGSVGLMQINMHVWRGVYDIEQIQNNVGYNAHAGNEILVHYLVDYAIRRNEHEVSGDADNLARAAYAMYNGGPRHLGRYRDPKTSASLRKIDSAFWAKYQAIQDEGPLAVKPCLAGS